MAYFNKLFSFKSDGKVLDIYFLGIHIHLIKNKKSKAYYKKQNAVYELSEKSNVTVPKVLSDKDTLDYILTNNVSVCRYGDGEFKLLFGHDIEFQKYDSELCRRLKDILVNNEKDIITGIPAVFSSLSYLSESAQNFWRKFVCIYREDIYKLLDMKKTYYDTNFTRPYIGLADKSQCSEYFECIKQIWDNRNIVFVEGEASRLGIGNDLFNNAKSIKRILAPAVNAFDKYDAILNRCKQLDKDDLILCALGPTATVLAFDLSKFGYRAIDLGHLDIEYEWFLNNATHKTAIKGKYTNEAKNGRVVEECNDDKYLSQIIEKIL